MNLSNLLSTKGFNHNPRKHHRKNGKGRLYKTVTIYTGPARDANQKTTITKHILVSKNLHF